jgi:hypothetical protein
MCVDISRTTTALCNGAVCTHIQWTSVHTHAVRRHNNNRLCASIIIILFDSSFPGTISYAKCAVTSNAKFLFAMSSAHALSNTFALWRIFFFLSPYAIILCITREQKRASRCRRAASGRRKPGESAIAPPLPPMAPFTQFPGVPLVFNVLFWRALDHCHATARAFCPRLSGPNRERSERSRAKQ